MNTVDDNNIEDYVYAIGEITDPKNILNFSKISNDRIRIYLKDKETAEQKTKSYDTIKIKNVNIPIVPSKWIIISNACPEIPYLTIENTLKQLGLKSTSKMSFLRIELKKPYFEHILGSRRSIFISNDFEQFPETTTLEYGGYLHRISLTDDSTYCQYCKKYGHRIVVCK